MFQDRLTGSGLTTWELLQMGAPEISATSKESLGVVERGHRRADNSNTYGGTSEAHSSLVA